MSIIFSYTFEDGKNYKLYGQVFNLTDIEKLQKEHGKLKKFENIENGVVTYSRRYKNE